MKWDTVEDHLVYKPCAHSASADIVTKREVVRRVSSLYDPLGLLASTHVKGKIFIQTLWKEDLAWDQSLSEQQCQTWNDIEKQLNKVTEIRIPQRCTQGLQAIEPCQMTLLRGRQYQGLWRNNLPTPTRQNGPCDREKPGRAD